MSKSNKEKYRYSVSLITQGKHRFYTLTMPSDVLADCSFVSRREDDPERGFQRLLDEKRALEIATYIDSGFGTIPSSIVLSAQPEAKFRDVGKGKTIEFYRNHKAFLVLDGQHRVYGFSKAKSKIRVPVVIYNNLSRNDETKLFIDINTKQRPVPNVLLLDIKSLAQYETVEEAYLSEIFNLFNTDQKSPLLGIMSPSTRAIGKINRVSFYGAVRQLLDTFTEKSAAEAYTTLSPYIESFIAGLNRIKCEGRITNPVVLKAVMMFFPEVAQRVKDKFNKYTVEAFDEILSPFFSKISPAKLKRSGYSHKELHSELSSVFRRTFIV